MKVLSLHREALRDLAESARFYEQSGNREIAVAFVEQVQITLALVESDPRRFPRVLGYSQAQKCRVKGFPHSIYYINQQKKIWVLAIAHGRRQPGFWVERLR